MKTFFRVSFLILLIQSFLHDMSFAMDPGEEQDNPEIPFSAYQRIFHAKLAKLKGSIAKCPNVFLSYSRRDDKHTSFIEAVSEDLKLVGFNIESARIGVKDNSHQHADRIKTVDKVILIGSPFLKQDYGTTIGDNISSEINNIRTRANGAEGLKGIIPVWFEGKFEDSFPWGISYFPARYLDKKSVIDTNYFSNFFELLMDIFHTEEQGTAIVEKIQKKKKSFIEESDIPKEILKQYEEKYLKEMQARAEKVQQKRVKHLGLNEEEEPLIKKKNKKHNEQSYHDSQDSSSQASSSQTENHLHTIHDADERTLVHHWGSQFEVMTLGNLPETDHDFVESIPEEFDESYLVRLGNMLHFKKRTHSQASNRKKITITGLGGVGKSSLALAYAHLCKKHQLYEVIHWCDAEEKSFIIPSYRSLLRSLDVSVKNLDDDEILNELKKTLRNKKYLLIFDNVSSLNKLSDILPQGDKGHILITSRHYTLKDGGECLKMDTFRPQEAIDYIFRRITHIDRNEKNEQDAKEIAKKLGYLPLALSQMVSYVFIKEDANGFQDYLQKFRNHRKTVLAYEEPTETTTEERTKRDLARVVYTTWDITLSTLGSLAQELMASFSYLSPDNIHLGLFKDNRNEGEIEKAIDRLKAFSMIKRKGVFVSLHRLVQKVGRLHQQEKNKEKTIIEDVRQKLEEKAHMLFAENFDTSPPQISFSFLPHFCKLYTHANKSKQFDLCESIGQRALSLTFIEECSHDFTFHFKTLTEQERISLEDKKAQMFISFNKVFQKHKNDPGFGNMSSKSSTSFSSVMVIDEAEEARKNKALQLCVLGMLFYEGSYGVEKSLDKAKEHLILSANLGSTFAQSSLGAIYAKEEKYTEALTYTIYAAEKRDSYALYNLGDICYQGNGVPKNILKSCYWFLLADLEGHQDAMPLLCNMNLMRIRPLKEVEDKGTILLKHPLMKD